MNNKLKKNLVMIAALSAAGLVALLLLIYMLILFFDWSTYSARTKAARDEVQALVRKTPAPGRENEERIKKHIEFYQLKSKDMVDSFKSPLRPAVDAFLAELPAPLAKALTDEEKEYYKKPGTGIEGDEETKAVPLQIRKLSYDDFRKFFNERFDNFCNQRNYTEDKDRFSLTTLSLFRSECVNLFPAGGWKRALDKFVEKVKPLTNEPVNEADPLPLLLVGFGMPRRVSADQTILARHVDDIIEQKIIPMAEKGNLELGPDALKFIGGSTETKGVAAKDYPMAYFHWEVFGDIVHRLTKGKAVSLQEVILRTAGEEVVDEMGGSLNSGKLNLENSFEQDGSYRLYHYTIVFTGNMSVIREVLRTFDNAWKENRMYVVRGISLYAGSNGAAKVMEQRTVESANAASAREPQSTERTGSRRRRRRAVQQEEQAPETAAETKTQMSEKEARESHYRVIMKRKQKAAEENGENSGEANGENNNPVDDKINEFLHVRSSADTGSHSDKEKEEFFAELEKRLAPHERFGYGKALIGGEKDDDCLVYLDVDYVVLEHGE